MFIMRNLVKPVICCGNIAYDLISHHSAGESDFNLTGKPGGSVLNTALHLARLQTPVTLVTKTGKDLFSKSLIDLMRSEGINTRFIAKDPSIRTGLALAFIDENGDPSYTFYKASGPKLLLKNKMPPVSLFKKAFLMHTGSSYSYDDYSHDDTLELLGRARDNNVYTTFDPNWRADRIKNKLLARKRIKKILEIIDVLKLSSSDAIGITGSRTLNAAIKRLPPGTFITLGNTGSLFWSGGKRYFHPSFRIPVKDTIGAGDAFTAGLIHIIRSRGLDGLYEDLPRTMRFASGVAALVCSGKGALEGLRSLDQVELFLRKHRKRRIP